MSKRIVRLGMIHPIRARPEHDCSRVGSRDRGIECGGSICERDDRGNVDSQLAGPEHRRQIAQWRAIWADVAVGNATGARDLRRRAGDRGEAATASKHSGRCRLTRARRVRNGVDGTHALAQSVSVSTWCAVSAGTGKAAASAHPTVAGLGALRARLRPPTGLRHRS